MRTVYLKIKEELDNIPVIDAHEHSCGHYKILPASGVTSFFINGYMRSLLLQVDPYLKQIITDANKPDKQRWQVFLKLWPYVKCTGYGTVISELLQQWKLPNDLTENSYEEILAIIQQRSPENGRKLFREADIKAVLTHYLSHPSYGGLDNVASFLDGSLHFESEFFPLLGTLPLHKFYQISDVKRVGHIINFEIDSLDKLVKGIQTIISRTITKGVIGLKDHSAYSRGLNFGFPDKKSACKELDRLLKGERLDDSDNSLSDYLFHVILRCADDYSIPVAIHTGYLVGTSDPKTNVKYFTNILEQYPKVKFDLYHLNYPWFEDLLSILKRFPNTVANCCWTHSFDPEGTEHFLSRALSLFPSNRIIGFGGDYFEMPEFSIAHLKIAKNNIAGALSKSVTRGRISMKSTLEIARMWLYENPKALYLKDHNI